jgi:hypothetical protein
MSGVELGLGVISALVGSTNATQPCKRPGVILIVIKRLLD